MNIRTGQKLLPAAACLAVGLLAAVCSSCRDRGGSAAPADANAAAATSELSGTVEGGVRVVRMKARKFQFEPARVVVGLGEKVRLEVTSQDVEHGIAIVDYGIEKTLPPGQTQAIEFTADKPGVHGFACSVFCGAGHAGMKGELVVAEKK